MPAEHEGLGAKTILLLLGIYFCLFIFFFPLFAGTAWSAVKDFFPVVEKEAEFDETDTQRG